MLQGVVRKMLKNTYIGRCPMVMMMGFQPVRFHTQRIPYKVKLCNHIEQGNSLRNEIRKRVLYGKKQNCSVAELFRIYVAFL